MLEEIVYALEKLLKKTKSKGSPEWPQFFLEKNTGRGSSGIGVGTTFFVTYI